MILASSPANLPPGTVVRQAAHLTVLPKGTNQTAATLNVICKAISLPKEPIFMALNSLSICADWSSSLIFECTKEFSPDVVDLEPFIIHN